MVPFPGQVIDDDKDWNQRDTQQGYNIGQIPHS